MMKGQCLCAAVKFTVDTEPQGVSICHCSQCRKQSGHVWASSYAPLSAVEITGPVKWYAASPSAKRGFCPTCGAFLFWKAHAEDSISFSIGALDMPTGQKLKKHIFVADKGDYYEINDGLPQHK